MTKSEAAGLVRDYLLTMRKERSEQRIRSSEMLVIASLLEAASDDELIAAWHELLESHPRNAKVSGETCDRWQRIVETIVSTAAYWSPERIKSVRVACSPKNNSGIVAQDRAIANMARELARLLRERGSTAETLGIRAAPGNDPISLLWPATQYSKGMHTRYLFADRVKEPLENLQNLFDYKYWPDTADLLDALADAHEKNDPQPDSALTRAAMVSRQGGLRDFFRALDQAFEELWRYRLVQVDFSDAAYAAIADAALGLKGEITTDAIAQYRREQRKSIR